MIGMIINHLYSNCLIFKPYYMYKVKILLVAFCILLGVSVELFTTVISRNRTIEDLNEKLIQKAECDSNARLLTQ